MGWGEAGSMSSEPSATLCLSPANVNLSSRCPARACSAPDPAPDIAPSCRARASAGVPSSSSSSRVWIVAGGVGDGGRKEEEEELGEGLGERALEERDGLEGERCTKTSSLSLSCPAALSFLRSFFPLHSQPVNHGSV